MSYKGWFWDDVNKKLYRWHDLKLLMKERQIKNAQTASIRQTNEKVVGS